MINGVCRCPVNSVHLLHYVAPKRYLEKLEIQEAIESYKTMFSTKISGMTWQRSFSGHGAAKALLNPCFISAEFTLKPGLCGVNYQILNPGAQSNILLTRSTKWAGKKKEDGISQRRVNVLQKFRQQKNDTKGKFQKEKKALNLQD